MTPAACGAVSPTWMVQARTSLDAGGEVGLQAEQRVAGADQAVEAGFVQAHGLEELLLVGVLGSAISASIAAQDDHPAPLGGGVGARVECGLLSKPSSATLAA